MPWMERFGAWHVRHREEDAGEAIEEEASGS